MNTAIRTILFWGLAVPIFAQTQISGIINLYAAVNAIEPCTSKLTVDDASNFAVDDFVLIIQMKGTTINTSNSSSFGDIDDIGAAGFYEKNEILSISGNEIYLKKELLNSYSTANSVQLVSLPVYSIAEIVGELTAKPWDGQTGGILALEATNLVFQASIDVSGIGFRGASKIVVNSGCSFLTNADSYHYSDSDWRGSSKGEGIAEPVLGKEHGRGAQANGGGGGNDHNSGGGGGGNTSAGGIGGKQNVGGFGCDGDYPGRGGKACPSEVERIFMGGGGGSGHTDDTGAGSSGSNGGGIAIVIAQTIQGNGFKILANGIKPALAQHDGAGGGGAGGTVLLKANSLNGDLSVEAKGGGGGDVKNDADRCDGAGGGGSGGRLLTNVANLTSIDLTGGIAGVNTVTSSQCNGQSNGAEAGDDGLQSNLASFLASQNPIIPFEVIAQPSDVYSCVGLPASLNFQVQGNYLNYQWQINTGQGWQNVMPNGNYTGGQSNELDITSVAPVMNGFQFRCLVTSICMADFYSDEVNLILTDVPNADFTVNSIGNGVYTFVNNSSNTTNYVWDFGDGNTSNEIMPSHSYSNFGNYIVTLTAEGPCGQDVFTYNLMVATTPEANFSYQNTGECAPQTVQYSNSSTSNATGFQWFFEGGSPNNSTNDSPIVIYSTPGTYDVMLIATNAVGADTFLLSQGIEIGGPPVVDAGFSVSNLIVSFDNLSLNASDGYLWEFGDGQTSTETSPIHAYATQGLFQVTLTAYNNCGETSITMEVPTGSLPLANFTADHVFGCTPMLVEFQNLSAGANITALFWEFEGGTPSTSTDPNPIVTYSEPGSYKVSLTATNALGSHSTEELGYINVQTSPVANFSFLANEKTVYFTNSSFGGSFYHWEFGDGYVSQAVNPVHEYASPGVYDVTLTTGDQNCGSAISHQVYIEPSSTTEGFGRGINIFPNPTQGLFMVEFADYNTVPTRLRITDSIGKMVQQVDIQSNSEMIDLSRQTSGMYFLTFVSGEKMWVTKLVKQ